jgi:predicted ATPase/DNA-binding SARP family transcriptional activator
MEFGCLGVIQVAREGRLLDLGSPKQRALLAILLLHANEVVSTDRLIDLLWAENPPASARKVLQLYVSQLRRTLASAPNGPNRTLTTSFPGYALRVERDACDLYRFEDLITEARRMLADGEPAAAASTLTEALGLWRGQALADFRFEPFAQEAIGRLEAMRLSAVLDHAEAVLALGRHAEALAELQPLVGLHPTEERLARLLMLAQYRAGRQADALDDFRRIRDVLVDELGIEPGRELQDMQRKVLAQDDSLRWVPPRSHLNPNNLPVPPTSFVGRAGEVDTVKRVLGENRVVTLTGAGGCGKSRLALEVAIAELPGRPDGVWLVELAPVEQAELVEPTIAAALALSEEAGVTARDAITTWVGDRATLLVLDNCEHLIESSAKAVDALLARCPNLKVLATSREPLAIPGEVVWEVPPLSFPQAEEESIAHFEDYEAIRLFVERARASLPEFRLTEQIGPMVAQICRRLDGMPLAIELAVARVRTMPVRQIATRLDDRFRLLTRGSRTAPPRHRTLQDVIDWSFQLLEEDERRLFTQLSVFAGGFSLAAAEAVCHRAAEGEDTLEILSRLVEKSLLNVDSHAEKVRYRLLETMREYGKAALEEAGAAEQTKDRHAAYCLSLAEGAQPHLKTARQQEWLEILEEEHDNLRTGLVWLVERGQHEKEVRLASSLWRYFYLRGRYSEGRTWLENALAHGEVRPHVRAAALNGAGALAFYQCDYGEAERRLAEALELFRMLGDKRGIASAVTLLGGVARERADYDRCLELHAEALAAYREVGDAWGTAHSLEMSGFASWLRGALKPAEILCEDALGRFRELDDAERVAWTLMDLGAIAHYRGDEPRARSLLEQSTSSFEAVDFKEGLAWSFNLSALIECRSGDYDLGLSLLRQALSLHRELGDRWRVCSVLEAVAMTMGRVGSLNEAAVLLGAADRLRVEIGTPVPPCEEPVRRATFAALKSGLGDEDMTEAHEEGRQMTMEEACRLVNASGRYGARGSATVG